MSKKRKKRPQGKPSPFRKQVDGDRLSDAAAARAGLTKLPTPALVATIDTMIAILQERGIKIRDWDEKGKVVQKMKCIGNKVYILAPDESRETEAGHGGNGEHNTG